jgi:hypothetical protein
LELKECKRWSARLRGKHSPMSDHGNCNRVGNRIEIEKLVRRFKISEPKLVLCTVREQSPSTAGLDDEKVFGASDTEP